MATFLLDPAEQLAEVSAALVPSYTTYQVRLLKAAIPLQPPPTLAALVALEADFSGYALAPQTGPPLPYPDLVQQGISYTSPNNVFTVGAAPTVGNNIYGFFLASPNPAPTKVVLTAIFARYVGMQGAGDQVNLQFSLNYFGSEGMLVTVNGELI